MNTEKPPTSDVEREVRRREFVQAAVGSGFAAAVLPVAASTVISHTQDLVAGPVSIQVGEFSMPAYRAMPTAKPKSAAGYPVILVVSEVFGVHEHIADVARRFAKLGYLAVAPELFKRQGDAGSYTDIQKLIAEVVAPTPDAQVMADLDATAQWAGANGGDLARLGLTGFCWGGRITWLYAAHNQTLRAGVAWYGRLVGVKTAKTPAHPVDLVAQLHAPVLGLYGEQDQGIPIEDVQEMQATLGTGGAPARASHIHVYPQAGHAFHADYRPSYRAEEAQDGWKRCLAWFAANGVA